MFKHLTVICESEITHIKIISPDAKFMIASIMHYEGQGCTLGVILRGESIGN